MTLSGACLVQARGDDCTCSFDDSGFVEVGRKDDRAEVRPLRLGDRGEGLPATRQRAFAAKPGDEVAALEVASPPQEDQPPGSVPGQATHNARTPRPVVVSVRTAYVSGLASGPFRRELPGSLDSRDGLACRGLNGEGPGSRPGLHVPNVNPCTRPSGLRIPGWCWLLRLEKRQPRSRPHEKTRHLSWGVAGAQTPIADCSAG
jgi:hypothetical protein